MKAAVGDTLVVQAHHVGQRDREAVILEVRGPDGGPPYVVRWSDRHEGLFFPGSDAIVRRHDGSGAPGTPAAGPARTTRRQR